MKKGFTLIEMIAVIVLLGVLGLLAVTNVDKILKDNKQKAHDTQIENIIDGAKLWASNNVWDLPSADGEFVILSLSQLKDAGYVKSDIKDPLTNEEFNNDLQVKITVKNNNYSYEIVEE